MKAERCPGCRKRVVNGDEDYHAIDCIPEYRKSKYDETDRDDFDRRSDEL